MSYTHAAPAGRVATAAAPDRPPALKCVLRVPPSKAHAYCTPQRFPEFTPAWRKSGLPSRPSHLALDPRKSSAGALVDPGPVKARLAAARGREVLSPPRVFEYCDDSLEPHHLQETANLRVRAGLQIGNCSGILAAMGVAELRLVRVQLICLHTLTPAAATPHLLYKLAHRYCLNSAPQVRQSIAASKKAQGLATGPRPGAWSTLTQAELRPRLEAAEARHKELALHMSSAQWEAEERCGSAQPQPAVCK